ncbi:hypothetical protein JCM16303_005527 [Sporobolomyces ruberrimus]
MASTSTSSPPTTSSRKLVLLGESAVGKSSLVLQFVKGQFDDYRESTIGAAFLTQTVQRKDKDNNYIKFELWDTAGQERYKSLAPMYYRSSHAAVVVYDITSSASLEKARSWIAELHRQADPSILIYLAGNKLDLASGEQRQVSKEEAQKFAQEEGLLWSEVSAKTGQGINEIFQTIAEKLTIEAPSAAGGPKGGRNATLAGRGGVDLKTASGGLVSGEGCAC